LQGRLQLGSSGLVGLGFRVSIVRLLELGVRLGLALGLGLGHLRVVIAIALQCFAVICGIFGSDLRYLGRPDHGVIKLQGGTRRNTVAVLSFEFHRGGV